MAPAAAGVHVLAWGTNWKIRIETALARTPALTLAVGAQLVVNGSGWGTGATAVADMLNLLRFALLKERRIVPIAFEKNAFYLVYDQIKTLHLDEQSTRPIELTQHLPGL
jgi:hypothetical protein